MRRLARLGPPLGVPADAALIDLGPDHPSRSGVVTIDYEVSDGVITSARISPMASHRGVEKLYEVRDYRQILALADRHDWQASFAGELGAVLTFEAALGLTPPARATWLRTVLAEHARLASHLAFASAIPVLTRTLDLTGEIKACRDALQQHQADLTGNRVHAMVCRLGGLAADASPEWLSTEGQIADRVAALGEKLVTLAASLPSGVAVLDEATIASYGVSGPAARAAGLDLDVRRQTPYAAYGHLDIPAAQAGPGDARARLMRWASELVETRDLLRQAIGYLTDVDGPTEQKLSKVIRVPEGDTYVETESPLGRAGWWLVSRGEKVPWRLKLRTPSFANVGALEAMLTGVREEDLALTVASMGYVVGDLAK